jgi:hypothetical protein
MKLSTVVQPCNASGLWHDSATFGLTSFDWSNAKQVRHPQDRVELEYEFGRDNERVANKITSTRRDDKETRKL